MRRLLAALLVLLMVVPAGAQTMEQLGFWRAIGSPWPPGTIEVNGCDGWRTLWIPASSVWPASGEGYHHWHVDHWWRGPMEQIPGFQQFTPWCSWVYARVLRNVGRWFVVDVGDYYGAGWTASYHDERGLWALNHPTGEHQARLTPFEPIDPSEHILAWAEGEERVVLVERWDGSSYIRNITDGLHIELSSPVAQGPLPSHIPAVIARAYVGIADTAVEKIMDIHARTLARVSAGLPTSYPGVELDGLWKEIVTAVDEVRHIMSTSPPSPELTESLRRVTVARNRAFQLIWHIARMSGELVAIPAPWVAAIPAPEVRVTLATLGAYLDAASPPPAAPAPRTTQTPEEARALQDAIDRLRVEVEYRAHAVYSTYSALGSYVAGSCYQCLTARGSIEASRIYPGFGQGTAGRNAWGAHVQGIVNQATATYPPGWIGLSPTPQPVYDVQSLIHQIMQMDPVGLQQCIDGFCW